MTLFDSEHLPADFWAAQLAESPPPFTEERNLRRFDAVE
jgi:hypothetical protein